MKCGDCGGSLNSGDVVLECQACAMFLYDCRCRQRHGYTPLRIVHCLQCDDQFRDVIDTTKSGWRGLEV